MTEKHDKHLNFKIYELLFKSYLQGLTELNV